MYMNKRSLEEQRRCHTGCLLSMWWLILIKFHQWIQYENLQWQKGFKL